MFKLTIPRQMGRIIKDKRLEKGFTQSKLAELSHTSRALIYRLERGESNGIMLDKLFDILQPLDLELAVLDRTNTSSAIQRVDDHREALHDDGDEKRQPLLPKPIHKADVREGKSENAQTQLEKEINAARNIKGFDASRYFGG